MSETQMDAQLRELRSQLIEAQNERNKCWPKAQLFNEAWCLLSRARGMLRLSRARFADLGHAEGVQLDLLLHDIADMEPQPGTPEEQNMWLYNQPCRACGEDEGAMVQDMHQPRCNVCGYRPGRRPKAC